MTPILQEQLKELQEQVSGARMEQSPGGGAIIVVPDVKLEPPGGWSKPSTTVWFKIDIAYPASKPDCFWIEQDTRLASGGQPQNSQVNDQIGPMRLWFSWHVAKWNPQVDTLLTYFRVIQERLRQAV